MLSSGVIISLVIVNLFGTALVIRSENLFNAAKMILLGVFIVVGLMVPMELSRFEAQNFVSPMGMVAGAMLIFLNYEGFELIANASQSIANPKRSLPIAYIGGVLIAIVLYVLIVVVVIGHLGFSDIAPVSDHVLSVVAERLMGQFGFVAIALAAILATSSAINATFYGSGRLTYIIAKSGELPRELERPIRGQHFEGTLLTAGLALIVTNLIPLEAIATMGSAGFLIIFMLVNLANVHLARETESRTWISVLAMLSTLVALVVLCIQVDENPATRNHLWILVGMVVVSILIELIYRYVVRMRNQ